MNTVRLDSSGGEREPGIGGQWLIGLVAAWLLADQVLLATFLGWHRPLVYVAFAGLSAILTIGLFRRSAQLPRVSIQALIGCMALAATLLVLGGEGRLFYANIDWQVRDAVLRDMAINPWPFAYLVDGQPILLRAPIGMYLIPAVAWKLSGPGVAALVLLFQNTLLIGTAFCLASMLFDKTRDKLVALAVVTAFGGLDLVGSHVAGTVPLDSLEGWLPGLQYSSTVTLAFWVPQHALAGWLPGVLFLLTRVGRLRTDAFLASVPLVALWSPLGLIGALPWAVLAGIDAIRRGQLNLSLLAMPALASLSVLPGLAYMAASGDNVGLRLLPDSTARILAFLAIEVVPWLVAVVALADKSRFGRAVPFTALGILVVLPYVQIGWSNDLMMRGSIPSLIILALLAADAMTGPVIWRQPGWHWWLAATALLATPTGLHEVRRALAHPAIGGGTCSFFKAWDQSFATFPKGSYLAPLDKFPRWLIGSPVTFVPVVEPERCWNGDWYRPSGV